MNKFVCRPTRRLGLVLLVSVIALLGVSKPAAAVSDTARLWDEFMHYVLIGKWELAQGFGQSLLAAQPDPVEVLDLSQDERYLNSYEKLLLLQKNDQLRDIARDVLSLIERGRYLQRRDVGRISDEVQRLSGTTRGRMLAVRRLKDSGEWAIPVMIQALRDPMRRDEYANIIWVIPQIGKEAINPLVVVLQHCRDLHIRLIVLEALQELGYPAALPYVLEILESPQTNDELRTAAQATYRAITRSDSAARLTAALEYEQLAEGYYNHRGSLDLPANQDKGTVWFWNEQQGLVPEEVDRGAFDELMTMRHCEQAIRLNSELSSAVSLWLSAFFRLEAEGQPQPNYFGANHAGAATYALVSGPEYLQQALDRAMQNRNQAVALSVIEVLQRNSGQQSLLYEVGGRRPLLEALTYPDREVRYRAALTIGQAQPDEAFRRSNLVMPILAEVLQQKGQRYAVVVDENQERRNKMIALLQASGQFADVAGDAYYAVAAEQSRRFPSVDLMLVSSTIDKPDLSQAFKLKADNAQLAFTPTVIYCPSDKLPKYSGTVERFEFAMLAADTFDYDQLAKWQTHILQDNHAAPFDQNKADAYAAMAADVLQGLAVTGNPVLPLAPAENALIRGLDDARENIRVACLRTLSRMDSLEAQRAVARKALDESWTHESRLLALRQLAVSAKAYGNLLLAEQIEALQKLATMRSEDDEMRSTAAQTFGALNLPSNQISPFIEAQAVTKISSS